MSVPSLQVTRRDFIRASAAGGFSLGGLLGLGFDLRAARISTPRGSIQAKALVTGRIRPYHLKGKTVHLVGLPWHWGYKGVTTGDVVNNLSALVGDPNVTIHEAKVFVCNVSKL
jgi:formate dehydrogenase major subunit